MMRLFCRMLLLGITFILFSVQGCFAVDEALFNQLLAKGMDAIRKNQWQEADKLLEQSLKEAEKFGPNDRRVAESLVNLAVVRSMSKNYAESISMSKRALAIDEKIYGNHKDVAYDYHQLGTYLDVAGHHEEATAYLKKALSMRKTVAGVEPVYVGLTLGNLGQNLQSLKKNQEALASFKEALVIFKKTNSPRDYFLNIERIRGIYEKENQLAKVDELYTTEAADLERRFAGDNRWICNLLAEQSHYWMGKKDYKRAEPVFRHLQQLAPKSPAGANLAEAAAVNGLAVCLFKQQKYADASNSFKRSLELIGPKGNPDQIRDVKLNLSDCLEKLGKKTEADAVRKEIGK